MVVWAVGWSPRLSVGHSVGHSAYRSGRQSVDKSVGRSVKKDAAKEAIIFGRVEASLCWFQCGGWFVKEPNRAPLAPLSF